MIKNISTKKRFMMRSFFRYFIIILIPILVVEPYTLYRTYMQIEHTIESENERLLYQAENKLKEMQRNVSNINYYLSKNTQAGYSARAILQKRIMETDMKDGLEMILQYLQNLQNTDQSIYSIYVYYENDFGRFFDSRSSIRSMDEFYDTVWIRDYLEADTDIWYTHHDILEYDFAEPTPVVTAYRRLYSGESGETGDGVVVVNYKQEEIVNDLNRLSSHENQTIAFLTDNGEVLVQNSKMDLTSVLEAIKSEDMQEPLTRVTVKLDGITYVAAMMDVGGQSMVKYLSLIPYEDLYQQTILLTRIILFSMAGAILISILLSWFSAKKEMNNLNSIVALLNNEVMPGEIRDHVQENSKDPYDYILFNILQIFIEQDYLKIQYSERKYKLEMLHLQALQQQINPHFINNTLNGIYWEAIRMKGGPNPCSDMVEKLSSMLEYTLEHSRQEVYLKREIEYLHNYMEIQEERYGGRIRMEWEIPRETDECLILKMLLQPLLENAIYHGIKEKEFCGAIKLKTRIREGRLWVWVIDTGMGVTKYKMQMIQKRLADREQTDDHIGLFNTNLRLILRYGEEAGVHFRSKKGMGTILYFSVPLEK